MRKRYQRRWTILIILVVFMIISVFFFVYLNAKKVRPVEAFHKNEWHGVTYFPFLPSMPIMCLLFTFNKRFSLMYICKKGINTAIKISQNIWEKVGAIISFREVIDKGKDYIVFVLCLMKGIYLKEDWFVFLAYQKMIFYDYIFKIWIFDRSKTLLKTCKVISFLQINHLDGN